MLRPRTIERRYALQRRIGVGGMGEVYAASSGPGASTPNLAIKRLRTDLDGDATMAALFLREVSVAATLDHINVVEVIDAGVFEGKIFMVMELVDGPSLFELREQLEARQQILPLEATLSIVDGIVQGLIHAHGRSLPDGTPLTIVHRDLAAQNVLVTRGGRPKLLDFGLATFHGQHMTEPGVVRGRPQALPPEQARGEHVDARTDVFALGIMLFELLTGKSLYEGEALGALLFKVAQGDYGDLRTRMAGLEPDLIGIVQKALEIDPNRRFQSARNFGKAINTFRTTRDLRMSRESVRELVETYLPDIDAQREKELEGSEGELTGQEIVLAAEPTEKDRRIRLENSVPQVSETRAPPATARVEQPPTPRAQRAPDQEPIEREPSLPRPSAQKVLETESGALQSGEQAWLFYGLALAALGLVLFLWVLSS